jgi:adenine-specific DNA methylase
MVMTAENGAGKLTCPCCQATLVVDRETLAILYFEENQEKAGGASFDEALQVLKAKEKEKHSLFQKAMAEEKQRRSLLGKKFEELQKQVAENPDAPPPPRPFDFE